MIRPETSGAAAMLYRHRRRAEPTDPMRKPRPIFYRRRPTVHTRIKTWTLAAVAAFAVVTAFACLGGTWWVFDLFAHFRVQYVMVAVVLGAVALGLGRRDLLAAVMLLAAPHVWQISPMMDLSALRPAEASNDRAIRVATFNAQWRNRQPQAVVNWVRASAPDILLLQEVGPNWRSQFDRLADILPHHVPASRGDGTALHLFSRHPIGNVRVETPVGLRFPILTAEVDIDGVVTNVAGVHAPAPTSAWLSRRRNDYLGAVAAWARGTEGPAVALGDFNTSPWSNHFHDLGDRSGLADAAAGKGWQPTWPSWMQLAGVPIDHVLVSRHIRASAVSTGPDLGSDHLPLIAELIVNR